MSGTGASRYRRGRVGGGVQHTQRPPVVSEKPREHVSVRGAENDKSPAQGWAVVPDFSDNSGGGRI